MTYVEGFLTPVPTANKDKYRAHAEQASAMLREFGVGRFVETWGDDVPRGKLNDLWGAVDARDDETVLFSWFEYPDKATREAAVKRMMDDPRMPEMAKDMPFDGKRMIYGGFESVSDAGGASRPGYVDGVVVPASDPDGYRRFAELCAPVFLEHGATRVVDTLADDVKAGEVTDFPRAVRLEQGETVGFGWVEWPDKAARDAGWEQVMADPRMATAAAPFDGKRMIFGGFTMLIDDRGELK
jgi:uncharacterized protein YbaA (DUF1428 family)